MTAPPAYDPARLRRSFRLKWERLGPGEYEIWGGAKPHFVKLDRDPPCDCEDWYYGGGNRRCKHLLRATVVETLILSGDGALLQAMEAMLERDETIAQEYHQSRARRAQAKTGA